MRLTRLLDLAFRILLTITPFLFYAGNSELFEFNKMVAVYGMTVIIAGLWVWRMIVEKKIIFRRTFLDIPLLIFLLSQVLSTIFSIDRHVSLWGYYSRFNGGLVSIICYLVLYWAYTSNTANWETAKVHLKFLLFSGAVVSVYGISEHFGVSPSCILIYHQANDSCWIQDVRNRVFATLGQPNWLAAWIVAMAPVGWALAVTRSETKDQRSKIGNGDGFVWVGIAGLFLLTTIYTKSRSGLLAFGVADLVFWGLIAVSLIRQIGLAGIKQLIKPFFIINSLFLILVGLSGTPFTSSVWEIFGPKQKMTSIQQSAAPALETEGTETSAIRKIVWKGAIDIGLAHSILGTGVETFAQSYYQYRPKEHNKVSEWDFLYNKAHNEFLNYWATTGIIGLGSYLLVIVVVVGWMIRQIWLSGQTGEEILFLAAFLAGYISILITNFFGFSVVNVQLLFFFFPAMAAVVTVNSNSKQEIISKESTKPLIDIQKIGIGVTAVVGMVLLWRILGMWRADTFYANANKLYLAGDLTHGFSQIRQALELNDDEPVYRDLLAQTSVSLAVTYEKEKDATLAAQLEMVAINQSDAAVAASPYNLQFWNSRTRIFYSLAIADKKNESEFMLAALRAISRATELAPTHPKAFYNLGLTQLQVGEVDEGKESLTRSLYLKPDYKEPRYALALLLAGEKKYQEAIVQGEYILKNIDPTDKVVSDLVATWAAELEK